MVEDKGEEEGEEEEEERDRGENTCGEGRGEVLIHTHILAYRCWVLYTHTLSHSLTFTLSRQHFL